MTTTLTVLAKSLANARDIYDELSEAGITTGPVGAAKRLVQKLESTITFYEKNGDLWDQNERLACNAWRMQQRVETGEFPHPNEWMTLDEEVRATYRLAAAEFRAGGTDV